MDHAARKPLNMADALVLIAATAVGLALGRAVSQGGSRWDVVVSNSVSVALVWTVALLVLNLTRHRAPRRELACRPGFSALVAVVVERLVDVARFGLVDYRYLTWVLEPPSMYAKWLLNDCVYSVMNSGSCAAAVAAVWLVTAMAGCWHPEKTWIDRTGRLLGVFWLVIAAVYGLGEWAFLPPPANNPTWPPPSNVDLP